MLLIARLKGGRNQARQDGAAVDVLCANIESRYFREREEISPMVSEWKVFGVELVTCVAGARMRSSFG